jgi:hypothetical protein
VRRTCFPLLVSRLACNTGPDLLKLTTLARFKECERGSKNFSSQNILPTSANVMELQVRFRQEVSYNHTYHTNIRIDLIFLSTYDQNISIPILVRFVYCMIYYNCCSVLSDCTIYQTLDRGCTVDNYVNNSNKLLWDGFGYFLAKS